MESIQANSPVLARAVEFSKEATHRRELAQEAAAKSAEPLKQEPANRVTFSQEAQARLNAEKTHAVKLVVEVRNAARAVAAEERNAAMRAEQQKIVEARIADRDRRTERDAAARAKAEVANKAVIASRRVAEKVTEATRKVTEESIAKATEQRALKATEADRKTKIDDMVRTVKAQDKVNSDLLERQKSAVVVKNLGIGRKNNEVAAAHSNKVRILNTRVRDETTKAMKMYQHIDSMGGPKKT